MKPVVSAFNAWSCIVVSIFAIIILSVIGGLFNAGHHVVVGTSEDPPAEDGKKIGFVVFMAVVVYAVFLVFCASQAYFHMRQEKRGAISLR